MVIPSFDAIFGDGGGGAKAESRPAVLRFPASQGQTKRMAASGHSGAFCWTLAEAFSHNVGCGEDRR
jgi:hypothetical protein